MTAATLSPMTRRARRGTVCVAGGLGLMAGAYATYVGITWYRYGLIADPSSPDEADSLLDSFMPEYRWWNGIACACPRLPR